MIVAGNRGLQLNSLDDYFRYANCLIQSGITPRGIKTPQQVIVALQYGAELGLKPMQAMSTVMVVNGKPALYGDGMLAVAQSSGVLEDIVETVTGEGGAMIATCKVKRKGRSEVVATFSWADAQRAALTGSDTYKKYPQRMLKHRARAFALRDAFPDVLCGVMCDIEAEELTPTFESGAAQPLTELEGLLSTSGPDNRSQEQLEYLATLPELTPEVARSMMAAKKPEPQATPEDEGFRSLATPANVACDSEGVPIGGGLFDNSPVYQ